MNLKRLKKISVDELLVRGSQAFSAFTERRGWSTLAKLPTDNQFFQLLDPSRVHAELTSAEALLRHFQTRANPAFFGGFADQTATVAELRRRWPRSESEIIKKADRILTGHFDLLGLHGLTFGDPIDWHLEPVAGKRAPLVHWNRLDYLNAGVIGDKKIVWELNRHQHFSTLGQAYWLSGDERYAQAFVGQLSSWMEQNPPKLGINWASSLEVGFRAIAWLWAFYFFKHSASLPADVLARALKFIYLHGRHLETYLSTYFSPNTHLTGEALSLFYLGTLLPEFRAAAGWRQTGEQILIEQLERHVQPDGVYFEQSSYYHRYTTDFYTHFLILAQANREALPASVSQRLRLLLDHLMYITRPDGSTPCFGDDDGGRLVTLDQRPANDFRAALSTGAALFQRADYKQVSAEVAEETLWLLGAKGLAELDRVQAREPDTQSVAFTDGGYYVMRDGWTPSANYMLLDCGPHGTDNCGHAHADALSFELAANGRTLLIDPGTYTYTGSKDDRDWFRSSAAHNTLTVDAESSSVSAGPFSWSTIAKCVSDSWISRARFDYFSGSHDGYQRLTPPVTHARSVLFLKGDYWVLRDRVKSAGKHRYDLWFHFDVDAAPSLDFSDDFGARLREVGAGAGLEICSFARQAAWRREPAAVSHCYGHRVEARTYAFSTIVAGDEDLFTFLMPRAAAEPARGVGEIEALGGRAFEVVGESAYDIVMMRTGERVETARLASDFEWTWVRFADEGSSVPDELLLLGGHRLELEGREILHSGRRINYLVASRIGDHFRIETDDGILELSLPIHDFESAFAKKKE